MTCTLNDKDSTSTFERSLLVVLYADVAGSTQIYEQYGDTLARDAMATCIDVLTQVVVRLDGRLIKTIGDEVMCAFKDPIKAVLASNEMQMAVQRAGEEDRFAVGELRIKIGFHFGPGLEEDNDVFGEAHLVASQLVNMAKADQILTSEATLENVPPSLRVGSRVLESMLVDGVSGEITVYEMIWEVSGLTQVADIRPQRARVTHTELRLRYQGTEYVVDDDKPVLSMGRVKGNDVVVETDLTSRQHAEIEYARGRFHLSDNSSNGTVLINENAASEVLRRDKVTLGETGKICLGGRPEDNNDGVLVFECK